MKSKIYFYLPKGTINDATNYYCTLLESGFKNSGFEVVRISDKKDVIDSSAILTIRPADQIDFLLKSNKLINWFQGIGPEEYKLIHKGTLKSRLVSKVLEWVEKRSLKKSKICFFVSERMKTFYESKYNIDLSNKSIIIPCYNIPLDYNCFERNLPQNELKFVYAGGIFAWQCVEETLLLFKEIQKNKPSATLTLLTGDREKASQLIDQLKVPNVFIDYVKLDQLQNELSKYSYGFLLRKDDLINNVSTPTKMNSYLAAGLIPVYTSVIQAFEDNIDLDSFSLKFSLNQSYEEMTAAIISFHEKGIHKNDLFEKYQEIFDHFYNDQVYINQIIEFIRSKNGRI